MVCWLSWPAWSLQLSRGTSAAETYERGDLTLNEFHASIEPRHECRGNDVELDHLGLSLFASIEPRHECRGNEAAGGDGDGDAGASIEPRHECRGNSPSDFDEDCRYTPGFN